MARFDDAQKLHGALEEFSRQAANFRRLCVVACRAALASLLAWRIGKAAMGGQAAPKTVLVVEPVEGDGLIAALWEAIVALPFAAPVPADRGANWVSETVPTRLFPGLKSCVEGGGYLLLASSSTPAQHDRVSKILLKHGTGQLFTHEFTREADKKRPPNR